MKRIDRQTIQRIVDAADIVEVVSDFVTLKKRGANYIGLCPFHNERTPSFSVSPSRGICKCFSCGKGGSAVNFVMEIEQLGYYDALKYLARKYGIEIQERELTDEERRQESDREAMFAINDFAMHHFEHVMADTPDGRDIGMAYFRERGINAAMVERFHLGYALNRPTDLYDAALKKGFTERFLVETGLCSRNDQGRVFDRFRGRVIYPIFTVSGKVVGFGGRTLRSDKAVAKYVNSPESLIYSKRVELYGLYQSKRAINRKDKCILVEGYMDVISMHQSGIENVVASSGTSLTERQVNLIHRFTENVTVIYDSDAAGIKASLRGIDMLLSHGLNVKVVQFPPGEDPDSYAQSHSASELEAYLAENEVDFIGFKTRILLDGVENDPIARARAINDIVESVAVIPDDIARAVYIKECGQRLGIDDGVLTLQVKKLRLKRMEDERTERQKRRENEALDNDPETRLDATASESSAVEAATHTESAQTPAADPEAMAMRPYEMNLVRYVAKYGLMELPNMVDSEGNPLSITVQEFIDADLANEGIQLANEDLRRLLDIARLVAQTEFPEAWQAFERTLEDDLRRRHYEGIAAIAAKGADTAAIEKAEIQLREELENYSIQSRNEFRKSFLSTRLLNDADDAVRDLATNFLYEKYTLSRIHSKLSPIATEEDQLVDYVERALSEVKEAILGARMKSLLERINRAQADGTSPQAVNALMEEYLEAARLRNDFSRYLGDRVVTPLRKR